MRKFGIIAAVVAALIGGLIYYANQPDHYYRLGIETPEGVKSAANTFAVYQHYQGWGLPEMMGIRRRLEGDAVFLDLGGGRNVVALLAHGPSATDSDRIERLDNVAFSKIGQPREWYGTKDLTGTAPLEGDDMPTLVSFTDITNPKTAHIIRPDNFEAVFGPGYRFKRAWVEMTNGPVTRTIKAIMPWIGDYGKETEFERRLRETGDGARGVPAPGRNLRRD